MWVVANYVGCLSSVWPSDLKEIVASSGDALLDLPHDHCARYMAHVKAEACALLGDRRGLRETWDQYRNYFDCKDDSNEWFEAQRRSLLTDIPMLVRFLEQNRAGLYRRTVWGLRWRHISRSLGARSRLSSSMPIPWWAWWIVIWILIQLFRNS
jgi:hypothetical protein